jgi:hypothetical protein
MGRSEVRVWGNVRYTDTRPPSATTMTGAPNKYALRVDLYDSKCQCMDASAFMSYSEGPDRVEIRERWDAASPEAVYCGPAVRDAVLLATWDFIRRRGGGLPLEAQLVLLDPEGAVVDTLWVPSKADGTPSDFARLRQFFGASSDVADLVRLLVVARHTK